MVKKTKYKYKYKYMVKKTSGPRSRTAGKRDFSLVLILVQVSTLKSLTIYQKGKMTETMLVM